MITFFAPGAPQPKGSTRAFVVGGRAVITNDARKAKPWAAVVTLAAREAMGDAQPLVGPVRVTLRFGFARPAGHFGKRGLLPSAPGCMAVKPDVDKLARCTLDALTSVVFSDDARVVALSAEKSYSDAPGVHVTVEPA